MRFKIWIIIVGILFTATGEAMSREKTEDKPLVIILMGPPAAGKGSQATTLSFYLGLPHISTGDLFRDNIRNRTPVGKAAKSYIDQGKLVPDSCVLDMLFERVAHEDCRRGYILDGFPRTIDQAKAFDAHLADGHQVVILNLNVDDDVLIDRIAGRLACEGCSKTYHTRNAPSKTDGFCDECGARLYQRSDDNAEVFAKRLEVYREQTAPLIKYYEAKKGSLHHINAQNPKEQVFLDTVHALPRLPAHAP